jgi:hypothetical protein
MRTFSTEELTQVIVQVEHDYRKLAPEEGAKLLVAIEDCSVQSSLALVGHPDQLTLAKPNNHSTGRLLCLKNARLETVQLPQHLGGGTRVMLVLSAATG